MTPTTAAGRALLAYYYPEGSQVDPVHEAGRRDTLRDILAIEAEAAADRGYYYPPGTPAEAAPGLREALARLVEQIDLMHLPVTPYLDEARAVLTGSVTTALDVEIARTVLEHELLGKRFGNGIDTSVIDHLLIELAAALRDPYVAAAYAHPSSGQGEDALRTETAYDPGT